MKYINVIPPIYWPAHPDDPQGIRVASVFEFSDCLSVCLFSVCSLFVGKFSNFFVYLLLITAAVLARSPDDPQRIRVASVFELFSVCLFSACLQIL